MRYDDPEVRAYKLNVERNNGRAAMMGITGCLIRELLGVDALYPTGGFDGAAPPLIDAETPSPTSRRSSRRLSWPRSPVPAAAWDAGGDDPGAGSVAALARCARPSPLWCPL